MPTWLVFDTLADANSANDTISANMGLSKVYNNAATGQPAPDKQQTTSWAIPRARVTDGKYAFAKPPVEHMTGVTNYTEAEFSAVWYDTGEF